MVWKAARENCCNQDLRWVASPTPSLAVLVGPCPLRCNAREDFSLVIHYGPLLTELSLTERCKMVWEMKGNWLITKAVSQLECARYLCRLGLSNLGGKAPFHEISMKCQGCVLLLECVARIKQCVEKLPSSVQLLRQWTKGNTLFFPSLHSTICLGMCIFWSVTRITAYKACCSLQTDGFHLGGLHRFSWIKCIREMK